jgi:hypothetical protein
MEQGPSRPLVGGLIARKEPLIDRCLIVLLVVKDKIPVTRHGLNRHPVGNDHVVDRASPARTEREASHGDRDDR